MLAKVTQQTGKMPQEMPTQFSKYCQKPFLSMIEVGFDNHLSNLLKN